MDERTEELRLALVLNGGVSLAVWMGGVAFELNRLVREKHPVYRGLLTLTGTTARIDVISGTSAGGINGVALALAQVHDRSLYPLRDVWLETADLDRLLHEPDDPALRSLLKGDDWFLPRIEDTFNRMIPPGPAALPPADRTPVSLSLTTTLLDGQRHLSLDDLGAEIEDKVHRAVWRFDHLPGHEDFADRRIVQQLALAARSTASFPVAFEPVHYDLEHQHFECPADEALLHARTAPLQPVPKALLLDGGILDNKPFEAALEGIAKLPATANTRRVLAYVVPDPAADAPPRQETNGRLHDPTLAQTAWRGLVSIPAAQSIASHMAELRAHNAEAAQRWKRLVGAVVHVRGDGLLSLAQTSLNAYRSRRVDGVVQYLLGAAADGLADAARARSTQAAKRGDDGPATAKTGHDAKTATHEVTALRRATRQWLASAWRSTARPLLGLDDTCLQATPLVPLDPALNEKLAAQWSAIVPTRFAPHQLLLDGPWPWGRYTLQFVAEFTIELLRRTQRLQALQPRWEKEKGLRWSDPPPPFNAPAIPVAAPLDARHFDELVRDWQEVPQFDAKENVPPQWFSDDTAPLKAEWKRAYEVADRLRRQGKARHAAVEAQGAQGVQDLIDAWAAQGGERPPAAWRCRC
jgi:predicted acylesterase/phospholipase RssA